LSDRTSVYRLASREHWINKKSIRAIEREYGVGSSVLNAWCKRHGIRIRTKAAQNAITG